LRIHILEKTHTRGFTSYSGTKQKQSMRFCNVACELNRILLVSYVALSLASDDPSCVILFICTDI